MTLIASELGRYDIQISAALSETHFAREGQLFEIGTEYIIFWSGRSEDERSQTGVGFAIKSDVFAKHKPPRGVNDRLLTLRLPLSGKHFATLISLYAATMTNPKIVKENFYEDPTSVISTIPSSDNSPSWGKTLRRSPRQK